MYTNLNLYYIQKTKTMRKTTERELQMIYARFYNSSKSTYEKFTNNPFFNGVITPKPKKGKTVWDSQRKGTYVRAIHGTL